MRSPFYSPFLCFRLTHRVMSSRADSPPNFLSAHKNDWSKPLHPLAYFVGPPPFPVSHRMQGCARRFSPAAIDTRRVSPRFGRPQAKVVRKGVPSASFFSQILPPSPHGSYFPMKAIPAPDIISSFLAPLVRRHLFSSFRRKGKHFPFALFFFS